MSRVRADNYTDYAGTGSPTFPYGAVVTGVITATSFSGDGSNLTGIDSTALVDSGGTTRVQANASGLDVTGVVTATTFSGNLPTTNLTGTITNAQLAGSIDNSKLSNSTVSYGGVQLSLGGSDATPAFDLSNSTNYPYTSLTGITTDIVGDTTPQLGGNLDLNNNDISGTGNVNLTGIVTATGGFNIGIQSAGVNVTTGVITALNFIGAGNTFAINGSTVDVSIAGGGGGGGSYVSPPWYDFTSASDAKTAFTSWGGGYSCGHSYYIGTAQIGYKSNRFIQFAHIQDGSSIKLRADVYTVNPSTLEITLQQSNDVYTNNSYGGTASGYSAFVHKNAVILTGYNSSPGQTNAYYEYYSFTLSDLGVSSNYQFIRAAGNLTDGPRNYPQAWLFHTIHTKPNATTSFRVFNRDNGVAGLWTKLITISSTGTVDMSSNWTIDSSHTNTLGGFYHVELTNNSSWDSTQSGDFIQYMVSFRDNTTGNLHVAASDSAGNYTVHNLGYVNSNPSYFYGMRANDGSIYLYDSKNIQWLHFTAHNTYTTLDFNRKVYFPGNADFTPHCSDDELYIFVNGGAQTTQVSSNLPIAKAGVSTTGISMSDLYYWNGNTNLDINGAWRTPGQIWANTSDTSPVGLLYAYQDASGTKLATVPLPTLIS